jgi:hypothetical protein
MPPPWRSRRAVAGMCRRARTPPSGPTMEDAIKNGLVIAGRVLGWLLLVGAMVVAARDILRLVETGSYAAIVVGELWFDLHPGSLNVAQAVVQRYLHPALWDSGLVWLLRSPVWLVFAVPGLVLTVLCRPRKRRHFFG